MLFVFSKMVEIPVPEINYVEFTVFDVILDGKNAEKRDNKYKKKLEKINTEIK